MMQRKTCRVMDVIMPMKRRGPWCRKCGPLRRTCHRRLARWNLECLQHHTARQVARQTSRRASSIRTSISSTYQYTYTVRGSTFVDCFKNRNPEETNAAIRLTKKETFIPYAEAAMDVARIGTDGNQVTIQEAKDADFLMPITEKTGCTSIYGTTTMTAW